MTRQIDRSRPIPETRIFDSRETRAGYRINKFCMSLTDASNRAAFKADEDGYMATWGLAEEDRRLVRARDWKALIERGGNIYMVMKIGAVTGHGLYTIGAQQRGETLDQFLATRNARGAR